MKVRDRIGVLLGNLRLQGMASVFVVSFSVIAIGGAFDSASASSFSADACINSIQVFSQGRKLLKYAS